MCIQTDFVQYYKREENKNRTNQCKSEIEGQNFTTA